MNGSLSLNIRQGVSNEACAAYVARLKPALVLVQDETKLAALLLSIGVSVIMRFTGDDSIDGSDPVEFVRVRHAAAPEGCILHLSNEVRPSADLDVWTLGALAACEAHGRKACAFNLYTHESAAAWRTCTRALNATVRGGHWIGAHTYFDENGFADDIEWDGNDWLRVKQQYGGRWCVSELGFAGGMDAYAGWQGRVSAAWYAAELERAARYYSQLGVASCIFSWGKWP